jgi:predicted nucleic acid-binding protein
VRYLVGANVLSEVTKPDPDPRVVEWLRHNEQKLVVDPAVLGEVRFGILLLRRSARRARLERWFEDGVGRMDCLSWDAAVGLRWAQLLGVGTSFKPNHSVPQYPFRERLWERSFSFGNFLLTTP